MSARLVLASASPRRRVLLALLVQEFDVMPADVDEALPAGPATPTHHAGTAPPPEEVDAAGAMGAGGVQRHGAPGAAIAAVAARKASAVSRQRPGDIILGADTVIVHGGTVLGKASHEAAARQTLARLAGGIHEVTTALALARTNAVLERSWTTTRVRLDPLPPAVMEAYLTTGSWRGKAGAYGAQDAALAPFLHVPDEGWSNVVGLPLAATAALLRRHGVPCRDPPPEARLRRHNPF